MKTGARHFCVYGQKAGKMPAKGQTVPQEVRDRISATMREVAPEVAKRRRTRFDTLINRAIAEGDWDKAGRLFAEMIRHKLKG